MLFYKTHSPAPVSRTGSVTRSLALVSALLLAGCGSVPDSSLPTNDDIATPATTSAPSELDNLLREAGRANSPLAELYFLEAARLLVDDGEYAEADNVLNFIETSGLPDNLAADILLMKAEVAEYFSRHLSVLSLLAQEDFPALTTLTDSQLSTYRQLRGRAYAADDQLLNSAIELIHADRYIAPDQRQENHENIWRNLTALPVTQLRTLAQDELNFEFQGWYLLASIGKAYQYNLDRQLVELQQWRTGWTRHPAARILPQSLQLVEAMAQDRPGQIALLLPLNTAAGTIIRDGFMSAYYNVQEFGGEVPQVRFYDTSNVEDILTLHQRARDDGAEMIIGPLLKQHVARLQSVQNLGVPTLALNNVENVSPASQLLFQFALSPENEAVQIANKAWQAGHRLVAILSPPDNPGTDFYARKRDSFIQQWQRLGGTIVAEEIYQDQYTDTIENLLNLSDSATRKEQLSKLIGESLEFIQRRRQDIDFIFLIAQPGPARQIKPSLAYLYAGDIPVFATQDIYSGQRNPQIDRDLNGIRFSDSPWLLTDFDELKTQVRQLFPLNSAQNLRLQAFGIDAFRLYPRLELLETVADSEISGATGLLRLSDNHNIIRELSWASIDEGIAKPLE